MSDEDDLKQRGAALKAQRERHGLKQQELAEAIGLKDRGAIIDIEAGRGSAKTLGKAEDYLAGFEASIADEHEPEGPGVIEYRIAGNFGVSMVIKATGIDLAEAEASAIRIMKEMQGGTD